VKIENPAERDVFSRVRCMCGSCARDLLSTCACGDADSAREAMRVRMKAGATREQILLEYQEE
jgi:hypothetical protein